MQDKFSLSGLYHREIPSLLAELARTQSLLRLGRVGMNCGCEYTAFPLFAGGRSYSRLEHSLGVGLIVWHFTRDPAQAAAGLLHDVATPTFAHVVDFLRGDYLTQEATEDGTRERIAGSPEIQKILAGHGLTTDDAADYHRYPIADNDSPRLSADRLEYSLGNALRWGFLTREEIDEIYGDLRVGVNEESIPELVFGSPALASRFARAALACSRVYVSDADRYAMQMLSELLARALQTGALSPADLEGTEPELIAKLEVSPLAADWQRFRELHRVRRAETPPDRRPWRQIPAKKRRIDPLVEGFGRVSAIDPDFAAALAAFLAEPQTEWLLGE
ncbi:MAG: hypothetical protein J5789_08000 [Oscillospiraceae bacterium]|nr:hypothetical protein [Oscillospiraceae bacterium]